MEVAQAFRPASGLARQRLRAQHMTGSGFATPAEAVAWFGAVQAQDYPGALWAVGLRTKNATERLVEHAISDRSIVRTWPLRGTLHFVAPADVRWMLKYLAPRMVARAASRHTQLGLDDRIFARSATLLANALVGGRQLTRPAVYRLLESARISTRDSRGLHILWRLAHDGVICFGAREGTQHTFALLDEWVPAGRTLERDEALAELARRYFTSHGPATLQDFTWWSGLAAADAKSGLEIASAHLQREMIGGQAYWIASTMSTARIHSPTAWLLPPFDEYTVAYQDRRAVLAPKFAARAGNGIFSPTLIVDGQVVGTWARTIGQRGVAITTSPFRKLVGAETRAVDAAVKRYRRFIGDRSA